MPKTKIKKTIEEINRKIKDGKVIVVTADEMVEIVRKNGPRNAAAEVDVVTTGTFSPMCSSGAFINFGQGKTPIKAYQVTVNDVPAYAGLAAVDIFIGAAEPVEDDPLNKVHPGQFKYGGGHVIHDLVSGKKVKIKGKSYTTDCYPSKEIRKQMRLKDLPYAVLVNPRNACQNYNCAVNMTDKTKYTYMGVLKPKAGNINYATSGQLSPLLNDPYYKTIGMGTRIFLGGGQGYIAWDGTQHNPAAKRRSNGVPLEAAGTLMVMGNLKEMNPRWLVGVSILGYGCSLAVGIGVPIPILDEEIALYTSVSDEEIYTQITDYGADYPKGNTKSLGEVNYAELKSGSIVFNGQETQTVPISSYSRAREIATILKEWIHSGKFLLGQPQRPITSI
jgi:L-aspartate semialdehyde sulfurtransferase